MKLFNALLLVKAYTDKKNKGKTYIYAYAE